MAEIAQKGKALDEILALSAQANRQESPVNITNYMLNRNQAPGGSPSGNGQIHSLRVDRLVPFQLHPFKLYEGKRFEDMVQSVRANGINEFQSMTRREKLSYLKSAVYNEAKHIQKSKGDWREFLRFYAGLYKYQFTEALLIYAHSPDATVCGELKHWNAIGLRVHKGTRGIPIVANADRNMDIRYVFDIHDTYGILRGNNPLRQAALPDRHKDSVLAALQETFLAPPPTADYNKNLKWAIEQYVRDRCPDYMEGLRFDVRNSRLEQKNIDEINKEFADTVVDSVGYMACERFGIEKGLYDNDELAFQYLNDFNTRPAMSRLGAAVGQISQSVITLVAETVRKEQEKERMGLNVGRRPIHERGSDGCDVTDSGGDRGNGELSRRASASDGEIRQQVLGLPEREPSEPLYAAYDGNGHEGPVRPGEQGSVGNVRNGGGAAPETDAEAADGLHGGAAIRDGDPGSGGESRAERDSLQKQVTFEKAGGNRPSLFSVPEPQSDSADAPSVQAAGNAGDQTISEPSLYSSFSETPSQQPSRKPANTSPAARRARPVPDEQQSLFDMEPGETEQLEPDSARETLEERAEDSGDSDNNGVAGEDGLSVEDLLGESMGKDAGSQKLAAPAPVAPSMPKPPNFRITPESGVGSGGAKTKYRNNVEAIKTLQAIESDNRYATPEEQAKLALYAGWGGIPPGVRRKQ